MGFLDKLKGWDGNAAGGTAGTVDDDEWRRLNKSASRANPQLRDTFSDESLKRRQQARDNYNKREQC